MSGLWVGARAAGPSLSASSSEKLMMTSHHSDWKRTNRKGVASSFNMTRKIRKFGDSEMGRVAVQETM